MSLEKAKSRAPVVWVTSCKNPSRPLLTVCRSRAESLGISPDFYEKQDLHIHVPEGAVPKDGPSAGIGMCTALVSVLTGINVKADVAMTGEITLRGKVLQIWQPLKKLLAAHRGGIKTVLILRITRKISKKFLTM